MMLLLYIIYNIKMILCVDNVNHMNYIYSHVNAETYSSS